MDRYFVIRRLHSLAGVVPLGLFLCEHLLVNSFAATASGERSFDAAVAFLHGIPFLLFVELAFIVLPMAFHAVYGAVIIGGMGSNVLQYVYRRNAFYLMQRVTGAVVFVFVCLHLWMFRVQTLLYGTEVNFALVRDTLSNPAFMALSIIGTLCAAFHLANGLWNFCIVWGITTGPRAQKVSAAVFGAAGVALGALGANALLAFVGRGIIM